MRSLTRTFQKINLTTLVICAALLQLWDAIITHIFVGNGSVCEGNPFMQPLLKNGVFLTERIVSIAISVLLIYILSRYSSKIAQSATFAVVLLYGSVIIWNYSVLSLT
jgi:hypothetical protein